MDGVIFIFFLKSLPSAVGVVISSCFCGGNNTRGFSYILCRHMLQVFHGCRESDRHQSIQQPLLWDGPLSKTWRSRFHPPIIASLFFFPVEIHVFSIIIILTSRSENTLNCSSKWVLETLWNVDWRNGATLASSNDDNAWIRKQMTKPID